MKRWLILLYGIFSYLLFLGVFLYAMLFIGDLWISHSLDSKPTVGLGWACLVNLGLLTFFAVQHSGMARQGFKNWLNQYIPESAERSTYVLMSNLAMILIFAFWQPMGGTIWQLDNLAISYGIYSIYFLGWAIVLYSASAISHTDLFGLRQVWLQFRQKPYEHFAFRVPGAYKWVRHPLYVGWLMVVWVTPTMTLSHLLFSLVVTGYILSAIQLEERDLVRVFGSRYIEYRKKVPMLIPGLFKTLPARQMDSPQPQLAPRHSQEFSASVITRLPE